MSVTTATTTTHLTRSEIWTTELKEVLQDYLMAQKFVHWLNGFPDGDQLNIPSVGELSVDNYVENTPVRYQDIDTGEFNFVIDRYLSSGIYITDKAKQDSFYGAQLEASFVPKMKRAFEVDLECSILNIQSKQTPNNLNPGPFQARHRYVGSGTNEVIALNDLAYAKYALDRANVPMRNRIGIVDPSQELVFNKLLSAQQINTATTTPRWDGLVNSGFAPDMHFLVSLFGFDIYMSNYLADANETINGVTTTAGKANIFFSADPSVRTFIGAWRQMPNVESSRNKDYFRDEYVFSSRYGLDLYRPEALVTILTDTDQVYA